MFVEILAADKIKREDRQGTNSCAAACLGAFVSIKSVLDKHETSLSNPIETEIIGANNLGDRLNKLRNILK